MRVQSTRLNDFVGLQDHNRSLTAQQELKNSIKRNIIQPSLALRETAASMEYQTKITAQSYQGEDIYLLFSHIYGKEKMELSDRNLIRRILLVDFPAQMICSAHRDFVKCTKFLTLRKGSRMDLDNRFYMLLKGEIRLCGLGYEKVVRKGGYFGHVQLICPEAEPTSVTVSSDSYMLTIGSSDFQTYFYDYFEELRKKKTLLLPRVIAQKISTLQLFLLTDNSQQVIFGTGVKIARNQESIEYVYFITEGSVTEGSQKISNVNRRLGIEKCIGLAEILTGSHKFEGSVFVLDKVKAILIRKNQLLKYIPQQVFQLLRENIKELKTQSKDDLKQGEALKSLDNSRKFIKIRKVKLPYLKSLRTEKNEDKLSTQISSSQSYLADFVFVRNQFPDIKSPKRREPCSSSKRREPCSFTTSPGRKRPRKFVEYRF